MSKTKSMSNQRLNSILIGKTEALEPVSILSSMANRHGLITGATGTGKTVTLQVLSEQLSILGIPVFAADVKGDLSGLSAKGEYHPKISERLKTLQLPNHSSEAFPVAFWDIFGKQGLPIRTTISEVGPLLLSTMLDLNDTQEGVMHVAFRVADDEGLLLLDTKDLRAMLDWLAQNRKEVSRQYGNVSPSSIAAIQRRLLVVEDSGGELFFGEPAFKLSSLLSKGYSGRGVVNLLDATRLINSPRLYATFLLWLLSELFEELEEVGDQELPKLIFFFDEAHLLFEHASSALLEKIEQVVRLIRSKGVGVFFVTQHPMDIPDKIQRQLGLKIQHALRAYTPKEKKLLDGAAACFRANPAFNARDIIPDLRVGEALVSTLDEEGAPTIVERTLIRPPRSRIGSISEHDRSEILECNPLREVYQDRIDRESAYEILKQRKEEAPPTETTKKSRRQSPFQAMLTSLLRSVGTQIGRQIGRGLLGTLRR